MKINQFFVRFWPILVFIFFGALIIGSFVYHDPSWGFMDDVQHLGRANTVFNSDSMVNGFKEIISSDLSWGMFRPVYYVWVVFIYHIWKDSPLTIYVLIALFNLATLALWGYLLHFLFSAKKEDRWAHIFIFPLTFLVFTPLWNNFIYISVQQKFIVTLSALAILCFFQSYRTKKKGYILLSVLWILLSIGIHPEGIFLAMAFIGCIIVHALIKRKIGILAILNFLAYLSLFLTYFIFSLKVQMRGGYTARYKENINIEGIFNSILSASPAVKGMVLIAVIAVIIACFRALMKKEDDLQEHVILPLSLISYIFILTPWGFPNYHLSTLAPFVMGIFFPAYIALNKRSKILYYLNNAVIIFMAFVACAYIGIPRIERMAEKKKVVQFLQENNKLSSENLYFLSPPLYEATYALNRFTDANTVYLSQPVFSSKDIHRNKNNYLIFSDESGPLSLEGVRIKEEIYASNTWRICKVIEDESYQGSFYVDFKKNGFQKVILHLKQGK